MRVDFGTATSGGVISNTNDRILCIEFHARSSNESPVYVGVSDVTSENGRELPPGESVKLDFGPNGSVLYSNFYVSLPSGGKVDWTVIIA